MKEKSGTGVRRPARDDRRGEDVRPRPHGGRRAGWRRVPSSSGLDVIVRGRRRSRSRASSAHHWRRTDAARAVEPAVMARRRLRSTASSRRPRSVVVGAGASRARADEARPPPASVSREVRPAARGGAPRALRAAGRPRARPVRRARGRRSCSASSRGHDAVGVDVAAFNCLLMRVKTRRYDLVPARDASCATRSRGSSAVARIARAGVRRARWFAPHARRPSSCTSARSSTTTSTPTSCASCSRARRGRRASRRTSISTSHASRSASRTGATSTAASARRSQRGAKFLLPLPARHARADQGVPRGAARAPSRDVVHGDSSERRARRARSTRSSPRRRIRASSTTTSSTATRTSSSASTIAATASSARRRCGTSRRAVDEPTSTGSRRSSSPGATRSSPTLR
mgnify:CR=1 FL=1